MEKKSEFGDKERSHAYFLEEAVVKNAKRLYLLSKFFEERKDWASAYFFLVTSMEEAAKYFALHLRSETKIDAMRVAPADEKLIVDINDEKIEGLFRGGAAHRSKRITLLTQLIMALLNTHNQEKRAQVWEAFRASDYKRCPEISELMRVYSKVDALRNQSLYVERDGSTPIKFKEENFKELSALIEKIGIDAFESQRHIVFPKYFSYTQLEKNVERMLEQYKKDVKQSK